MRPAGHSVGSARVASARRLGRIRLFAVGLGSKQRGALLTEHQACYAHRRRPQHLAAANPTGGSTLR